MTLTNASSAQTSSTTSDVDAAGRPDLAPPDVHRMPHLPALDGLRGIAVAAVVVYHLLPDVLPGGFLGVDLFFVLSGFLITSLIVREHGATGRLALGRFYLRRLRRLTPALVLVIAVLGLYGWLWATPGELDRLRVQGLWSLGWLANWRFIADGTTYADVVAGVSPLRHMWSLAIEEQFYLLFPFVVLALAAIAGRRHLRRALLWFAVVGAAASAVWMAWVFDPAAGIERAYFGTDTRAHGLLFGVALGALVAGVPPTTRRAGRALNLGAPLAVIALGGAFVLAAEDAEWLYQGGFAGVAAIVTVIVASVGSVRWLAAGLSWRPLVALGLISYGVYLWHWPVIVILDGTRLGLEGLWLVGAQAAITLALAVASYHLVERPIRNGALGRRFGRWALAAAPLGIAAAAAVLVLGTLGPAVPDLPARAAGDSGATPDALASEPLRVVITGDSVAHTLAGGWLGTNPASGVFPAWEPGNSPFDPAVVTLTSLAIPQCSFLAGQVVDPAGPGRAPLPSDVPCGDWQAELTSTLASTRAEILVAVPAAETADRVVDGVDVPFGSDRWKELFDTYLDELARIAAATDTKLVLVTPPPRTGRFFVDPGNEDGWREARVATELRTWAAGRADATVVDLAAVVCPGGDCTTPADGFNPDWRYDGLHVDAWGARWFADWLAPQLVDVAGRSGGS